MQGPLQPGALPKLLGELCLGGRSGRLHLERGQDGLDVDLLEGRVVGFPRLERPEALFEAFEWTDGMYSFSEAATPVPREGAPATGLPQRELIREGLRRVHDSSLVRLALGDMDQRLILSDAEGTALGPTAAEDFVLSEVDGARSIRRVIDLVPLPAAETQRCILGLLCAGVLRSQPAATDARRAAAAPELQRQQVSPQGPASEQNPGDSPSPQEPVGLGRLQGAREPPAPRDAFAALGIPWDAPSEDPVENALQVADIIRRASSLMAESDHWGAIRLLQAVIPMIKLRRLRHDAQVLLARAHAKNPKWLRRGEALLQEVIREDPSCAEACFVLGTIYKDLGLRSRALGMFRKVVALEPQHALAAEALRSLEPRPPQRGLFGRT
jgi:Domain of unknown function (DUF4388)